MQTVTQYIIQLQKPNKYRLVSVRRSYNGSLGLKMSTITLGQHLWAILPSLDKILSLLRSWQISRRVMQYTSIWWKWVVLGPKMRTFNSFSTLCDMIFVICRNYSSGFEKDVYGTGGHFTLNDVSKKHTSCSILQGNCSHLPLARINCALQSLGIGS